MSERFAIPRRRLVNFRLTEEEYQRLRTASEAQGSRGLSEYARNTILNSLHNPGEQGCLTDRLTVFEAAMERLTEALNAATARFSQPGLLDKGN